jgi:streptogramin lyase
MKRPVSALQMPDVWRKKVVSLGALFFVAFTTQLASAVTIVGYPENCPDIGGSPGVIVAGPDGNLWFTCRIGVIGRITTDGVITEYPADGEPFSITAGPDGNLWFTDRQANRIGRISTDGDVTEYSVPTAFGQPDGITAGPDGNLWFTDFKANTIGKITTRGVVTVYPVPTADSQPDAITTGSDGNLWFTEKTANQIGKITLSGVVTEYPIPTRTSIPLGITAGPDGNLWFAELFSNNIGTITPAGVVQEYAVPSGDPYGGMAAGADGSLWFTEVIGHRIGRVTTHGVFSQYPVEAARNNFLVGITLGPDGNLWYVSTSQIGKVTPGVATTTGTGIGTTVATAAFNPKAGQNMNVQVDLTFTEVSGEGITAVNPTTNPAEMPPPSFSGDIGRCSKTRSLGCQTDEDCPSGQTCSGYHGFALDVSTTASVTGPITVCAHYDDNEPKPVGGNGYVDGTGKPGLPERSLRLLHEENGVFVDVTLPGYPDTLHNIICGQVSSLGTSAATAARRKSAAIQGTLAVYVATDMPGNGKQLDSDCMAEWSLGDPRGGGSPTTPKLRKGQWTFPDALMTCKASSRACKGDTPGTCKFRFRVCLNKTDFRFTCTPTDVADVVVTKPTDPNSGDVEAILEALRRLGAHRDLVTPEVSFTLPVTSPTCTDNIEITVPGNRIKTVSLTAGASDSSRDINTLKLQCKTK